MTFPDLTPPTEAELGAPPEKLPVGFADNYHHCFGRNFWNEEAVIL